MNIHFFDSNPIKNANFLDDIRVIKMITENFQMISAALYRHNVENIPVNKKGRPYKITHKNHPSTLWVAESKSNYLWLCDYTEALYMRYKRSGGKAFTNVSSNLKIAREAANKLPEKGLTPFVNCARSKKLNIDYTWMDDVNKAYFRYMNDRWDMDSIKLTWSGILPNE